MKNSARSNRRKRSGARIHTPNKDRAIREWVEAKRKHAHMDDEYRSALEREAA